MSRKKTHEEFVLELGKVNPNYDFDNIETILRNKLVE